MDNTCAADVLPALSCTVTMKLNGLPAVLAGVPAITPVAALSVRPGGNDAPVTVQLP